MADYLAQNHPLIQGLLSATSTGTSTIGGTYGGFGQQQATPYPSTTTFNYPSPVPEVRWPNQLCEILAEAGRLLLEENIKLKARVAELEAKQP